MAGVKENKARTEQIEKEKMEQIEKREKEKSVWHIKYRIASSYKYEEGEYDEAWITNKANMLSLLNSDNVYEFHMNIEER